MSFFVHRWVFWHDNKRSREFRTISGVVRRGMQKLPRGSSIRYDIIATGDNDGQFNRLTYNEASDRIYARLSRKRLGITYSVIAYADTQRLDVVRFRTLQEYPPLADVQGTNATRRWCGFVHMQWPRARFAGTIACKPGDHPVGAAADHFPPEDAPGQGDEMHEFAILNAEEVGTAYSIWHDEIWTAGPPWTTSPRGRRKYTRTYHLHHHWSGREKRCGVWCTPGYGECG